uniref:Uncharacterized protein LOC104217194 isoform X2 n=1 Tax=Nicotiana sylvestris TaxID=4096 RepID=A0A1U7VH48_NICSY|nr:PREDICTED: uncharacterized protein LOC104217194 isoform X2 [Nicotiana sylvestris]
MASLAPIFHDHYLPRFKHHSHSNNNSFLCSNPYSFSYPYCCSSSASFNWKNFVIVSGINSFWRNRSLRAQVMSSTERSVLSPSWLLDMEDKPEHLLVLVHGILASPSDWTYAQAELKKQLGRNFVIYGIAFCPNCLMSYFLAFA